MKKFTITKTKSMICLDIEVRCKRMSTAYRHFYQAIEQAQKDGAFGSYDLTSDVLVKPEECDWRYNTPIHDDIENTGYCVGLYPINNGWYLWANVTYKRMTMD